MESAQGEDSGSKFPLLYTNAAGSSGTERVHVTPLATIWWVLATERDSPFPWPSKIMLKNCAFTLSNLAKSIFNEENVYVCVACVCGSVGAICHTAHIWRTEDKFQELVLDCHHPLRYGLLFLPCHPRITDFLKVECQCGCRLCSSL